VCVQAIFGNSCVGYDEGECGIRYNHNEVLHDAEDDSTSAPCLTKVLADTKPADGWCCRSARGESIRITNGFFCKKCLDHLD
jgi:hypothetical protein